MSFQRTPSPPPRGEGPGVGGVPSSDRVPVARPPSGPPLRSGHLPHEGEGDRAPRARTLRRSGSEWEREAPPLSTSRTRKQAQSLRLRLTPPERRLWWHLRHRLALEGTHFRRQVAIDRYIVDFCCLERRLIVEVDGEQHGFEASLVRDGERTHVLEARGFRVIRFSNREVMTEIDVVLDTILAACGTTTPRPSPHGGGEHVGSAL